MPNAKALEILKQGVQIWNENWNSVNRDLSEADLHGQDLTAARFQSTNLACSNLEGCDLSNSHLEQADLSGATFGIADSGANLYQAHLRESNLRSCDLSGVKGGLQQQQLAGANLTGAILPAPLTRLFDNLDAVRDISESARKLFIAMLAGCLYSWLTIATTTDVNLITNRAFSTLPIIQTSIPVVGFYSVAPLLLLCVYFYFHFYLQKLWEELGSLPAIFPDGRCLHERSDPWLLNDLVRSHVLLLRAGRPLLSYFQQAISILLAWWLVPATLLLFWGRYLPRHKFSLTVLQAILLAVSITAAVFLYRLAAATLRGIERQPFSWKGALKSFHSYSAIGIFLATGATFIFVSLGAIQGFPRGRENWQNGETSGRWNWAPRAMALIGYSPFANLNSADLSVKPANWTGKSESELDFVKGAQLSVTSNRQVRWSADLRYADANGAFLAKAHLSDAHLEGADLMLSDLRQAEADIMGVHMDDADLNQADLTGARLNYSFLKDADLTRATMRRIELKGTDLTHAILCDADLTGANLRMARLNFTKMSGAILVEADLTFADFRSQDHAHRTEGLTTAELKRAKNSDKAYYDDDLLQQLDLPPDHNQRLEEEQKREAQQK
jgi:uncharacterized protein YjbI with pentapeptide repeats